MTVRNAQRVAEPATPLTPTGLILAFATLDVEIGRHAAAVIAFHHDGADDAAALEQQTVDALKAVEGIARGALTVAAPARKAAS